MRAVRFLPALLTALAAGSAWAAPEAAVAPDAAEPLPQITYQGIETILLDTDLVSFRLALKGAPDVTAIKDYARCAAAQYSVIRGYGYARHVRTNVAQKGKNWLGDAIFTISADEPHGIDTVDAQKVLRDCAERGIPTV